MGRALSPSPNDPIHDLVFTPRPLAQDIINHFAPSGTILDPSKGDGAFFDQYPIDCEKFWCEISEGTDFFEWSDRVDWIITNPPWSKMRKFIQHGMKCADNIVYLCTINHFMTKARLRDLFEGGFSICEIYGVVTPKHNWPQSGFQLAAVHLKNVENDYVKFTGKFGS